MSDRQDDEPREGESPIVAWVRERYEGVTLVGLAAFMLWVRMQSYDNFVTDGRVVFSGNDPYYHLRQTSYTVRHWPATMPFDPWTYYPYGTNSNQFGTLYDQLVATAALVVGLGDPSQALIAKTFAVSPAVLGALLVFPTYYACRRLGGVYGGMFGAFVLALLPGSVLSRTLVGSADHQAMEMLAQMTTVLALMVALGVAKQEKPVYELVLDRDYEALRRPVGWAAVAGVSMGLYVWTWPPAIFLIAIAGAFFALKMSADYYNGRTPEPVAFVAVVSMVVTGVVAMVPTTALDVSPTTWGPLQVVTAFAIAAGAVFLSWMAREWDDRGLDRSLYPLTVGGIALVGATLTSLLLPDVWSTFATNFQRIVGFSAGAGTRTIREAQPFLGQVRPGVISPVEVIMFEYGLMLFTAILALGVMLARPLFYSQDREDHVTLIGGLLGIGLVWEFGVGEMIGGVLPLDVTGVVVEMFVVAGILLVAMVRGDHDGEELLVAIWSLFMLAAAFTQVRFNYYLALSVVLLNAYLFREFLEYVAIMKADGSLVDEIEPYQMMAVILALLVVLPVLVMPITYYEQQIGQNQVRSYTTDTAIQIGNSSSPRGFTQWEETLEWVNESTPREGRYGGANNDMGYYGSYQATEDFSYEEGTYGVISWWDYGHWITIEGRRIPSANPFQQGATAAANFLLAPDESQANEVLQRGMSENEETRYVMVDWQMANPYGKFGAPTVFYDDANVSLQGEFVSPWHYDVNQQTGQARATFRTSKQRYSESTRNRLFMLDGSRAEPEPVVVDWTVRNGTRVIPENGSLYDYRRFGSRGMSVAERKVQNDTTGPPGSSSIGGVGHFVREPVPAMEQYRLVRASENTVQSGGGDRPAFLRTVSRVKVFEKVSGANVTGQGPPNRTIIASVEMALGSRNDTFTYTQKVRTDANGNFEMTVPYSTTGYDQWGPGEGYTNVSVRATGPYEISTNLIVENGTPYVYSATTEVTEAQVIGEDDSEARVELERQEINISTPGNSSNESANGSAVRDVERAPTTADDGDSATASGDVSRDDGAVAEDDVAVVEGDGPAPPVARRSGPEPAGWGVQSSAGGVGPASLPSGLAGGLLLALLAGLVVVEVRDDGLR
jgi:dolichyl-diphosphooligosaccharide--protein glycosyltransferase